MNKRGAPLRPEAPAPQARERRIAKQRKALCAWRKTCFPCDGTRRLAGEGEASSNRPFLLPLEFAVRGSALLKPSGFVTHAEERAWRRR
jgi:hypothetical protein